MDAPLYFVRLLRAFQYVNLFYVAAGAVKAGLFDVGIFHRAILQGIEGIITTLGNILAWEDVAAALADDNFPGFGCLVVVEFDPESF